MLTISKWFINLFPSETKSPETLYMVTTESASAPAWCSTDRDLMKIRAPIQSDALVVELETGWHNYSGEVYRMLSGWTSLHSKWELAGDADYDSAEGHSQSQISWGITYRQTGMSKFRVIGLESNTCIGVTVPRRRTEEREGRVWGIAGTDLNIEWDSVGDKIRIESPWHDGAFGNYHKTAINCSFLWTR